MFALGVVPISLSRFVILAAISIIESHFNKYLFAALNLMESSTNHRYTWMGNIKRARVITRLKQPVKLY